MVRIWLPLWLSGLILIAEVQCADMDLHLGVFGGTV